MLRLDTFYKSKEWTGLVERLKLERVNDKGQLICEYCGKPIVKKYDCIGHHVEELTEENVNDYSVSLNPENIKLIHFRCHNKIHGRFDGFYQSVYLVYGSPCSGMVEWVEGVAEPDDLILYIDRIWECLATGGRKKPNRIKANVFGVRDCIMDQIRTRTGRWRNAYVVGGYPLASDRERLCDMLRAKPVYIEATMAECLAKAKTEDEKEYIEDWFESFRE